MFPSASTTQKLPVIRVVRHRGTRVAHPRVPLRRQVRKVTEPLKTALGYMIALWPLTAIMLACFAMLLMAGLQPSP